MPGGAKVLVFLEESADRIHGTFTNQVPPLQRHSNYQLVENTQGVTLAQDRWSIRTIEGVLGTELRQRKRDRDKHRREGL